MTTTRVPSPWGTTFSDSISFDGPGRWIFVSGQIGAREEDRQLVNDSFAAEADQCFERIRRSLEKAGATMADVVKLLGFVTAIEHYPGYDAARGRAFPADPPASSTVVVADLALSARVEVEAIAFIPKPS